VLILSLMFNALSVHAYSVTYTSCGIEHTLTKMPSRIVTMNQGATELMLALGLADKMVGTAYLDDYIWPQYAEAYAKIPVLAAGYPNETTIMSVNPDFIVGSYNSAFHGTYMRSGKKRGIFSDATVGPCTGPGSEFADLNGKNYNRTGCRPQLNAAGIGTFLFADACEDKSLRPASVTEETVYSEMRSLGSIFEVDVEAMITEMKKDFDSAGAMVSKANDNKKLTVAWLDCVGRCCKVEDGQEPEVFVGGGTGAPHMLMRESGLKNVFEDAEGGWSCVKESAVIKANPDVLVVVDASWDTALGKITWLYNHSGFCATDALQGARFVQIPFSASTLSPRNGPAALDLAIAALHVRKGSTTSVQQSGVSSFTPQFLQSHTEGLKCALEKDKILYGDEAAAPTPSPPPATTMAATTAAPAAATTAAGPASTTKKAAEDSVQTADGALQIKGGLWLCAWLVVYQFSS